jgi:N-acetylmuramoyl-L-alanine amidase
VETYFLSPDRAPSEDRETAARENARLAAQESSEKTQPVFASVTVGNRVAESRELARYIQSGLVRGIGAASPRTATNRGVKHAAFVVLLGAAMPSVLAEVSFLSNPKDEALLETGQFRERIAASLFAGLNAYLKKNRPAEKK